MIVLDTHVLIWAVNGDPRLGAAARSLIEETAQTDCVAVSAITPWEIALLAERGRLRLGRQVAAWIETAFCLARRQPDTDRAGDRDRQRPIARQFSLRPRRPFHRLHGPLLRCSHLSPPTAPSSHTPPKVTSERWMRARRSDYLVVGATLDPRYAGRPTTCPENKFWTCLARRCRIDF